MPSLHLARTLNVLEYSVWSGETIIPRTHDQKDKLLSMLRKQELRRSRCLLLQERSVAPQLHFTSTALTLIVWAATWWVLKMGLFIKDILKGTELVLLQYTS